MQNGDYFVLKLTKVHDQADAWLSSQAFAFGALGISETLDFSQPEGEEDVFVSHAKSRALDVYFEKRPALDFLRQLEARFPDVGVNLSAELKKDWMAEWKKGFEPFQLAGDYWVVPSWRLSPVDTEHSIRIDPGMAFGTGTHETTKLVAKGSRSILRDAKGQSFLDVGTGTGILAILAARMGFSRVAATEIEEEARRVAHENFARNSARVELNSRQVEDLTEKFDVVVANIIDGVLVRIQDALKSRVKPGGWLLVSGIILEREQTFLEGFKLPEGAIWQRHQLGDWLMYSVKL
jgi:ribosomal protein L11 methyltransferase